MSNTNMLANKRSLGLVGKKLGTTHIFIDGKMCEATVLKCESLAVIQVKTEQTDGYNAVQVAYGNKKQTNKPIIGHFKDNKAQGRLMEFRLDEISEDLNKNIGLEVLDNVYSVKVTSKSKGKGFAGPVKRWNFRTQDATHGNSLSHRAHGSTGQCQDPGRVFKGKKMAGRMGHTQVTVKNLKILKINTENSLVYIMGSVPGSVGTYVKILPYMLTKQGDK